MSSFLIVLHVVAALILIGPVCVSTSTYQTQMLKAAQGNESALGAARLLHGITNTYGYISAIVPVLGIAVFLSDFSTYKSQVQFHISILLAIIAWCILFFVILPRQKKTLAALESAPDSAPASGVDFDSAKKQLSAFSGVFNLLWVVTAILMFL